MCPLSVYESNEASSGLSQRKGNQIDNLFGLPTDYLQQSRDPVSSNQDLFQILGLVINETKSQMTPTQEIVFLGFHLSSAKMTISLPQEKMKRIKQDAVYLQ